MKVHKNAIPVIRVAGMFCAGLMLMAAVGASALGQVRNQTPQAQPPAQQHQSQAGSGRRIESDNQLMALLNLSEQQKAQLKVIREKEAVELKPIHDQLRNLQDALICQAEGANFDENAVKGMVNQESQLLAEMNLIRLKTQNAVFNLLTPDQKARLAEYRNRMKNQRQTPPDQVKPIS